MLGKLRGAGGSAAAVAALRNDLESARRLSRLLPDVQLQRALVQSEAKLRASDRPKQPPAALPAAVSAPRPPAATSVPPTAPAALRPAPATGAPPTAPAAIGSATSAAAAAAARIAATVSGAAAAQPAARGPAAGLPTSSACKATSQAAQAASSLFSPRNLAPAAAVRHPSALAFHSGMSSGTARFPPYASTPSNPPVAPRAFTPPPSALTPLRLSCLTSRLAAGCSNWWVHRLQARLGSARLGSARLDLTCCDLTRLDLTWLDLARLGAQATAQTAAAAAAASTALFHPPPRDKPAADMPHAKRKRGDTTLVDTQAPKGPSMSRANSMSSAASSAFEPRLPGQPQPLPALSNPFAAAASFATASAAGAPMLPPGVSPTCTPVFGAVHSEAYMTALMRVPSHPAIIQPCFLCMPHVYAHVPCIRTCPMHTYMPHVYAHAPCA